MDVSENRDVTKDITKHVTMHVTMHAGTSRTTLEATVELEHKFEVPVGIDHAWTSLLDMEQVAACFPGATLTSADGDEYTGSVKVKLGPIQITYKGSARIVSADEATHTATIEASGNASRSSSTASMTVVATAKEVASDRTEVVMSTDLTITGRPAQFGRGVMAEVGDKILGRFADCVASNLAGSNDGGESGDDAAAGAAAGAQAGSPSGAGAEDASTGGAATGERQATVGAAAGARAAGGAGSGPKSTYTRSPEPIDLLESAGSPVLKRLAPVIGGLILLWLLRRLFKRRNRSGDDD